MEGGWGSQLQEDHRGKAVLGMDLRDSPLAAQNTVGYLDQWGRVQAGLDVGRHTRGCRMLVVVGNSHHTTGPWIHRSLEGNLSVTFLPVARKHILLDSISKWFNTECV